MALGFGGYQSGEVIVVGLETDFEAIGRGRSRSGLVILSITGNPETDFLPFPYLFQVDSEKCLVYVEGGVKISSLHKLLAPHSLAMSNLGSISDQTLAGALSTATHGTGVKYGNMSTFITFLDLVLPLPDAPVVRVSEELDPELFKSALCGLGAVGVIVGVGLQCEKSFNLEEECWTIKFEDFVERWKEIAESAEHVRCWWFPQVGEVKVSRLNRTDKVSFSIPRSHPNQYSNHLLPFSPSPHRAGPNAPPANLPNLGDRNPPRAALPRPSPHRRPPLPQHPTVPRPPNVRARAPSCAHRDFTALRDDVPES